MKKGAITVLVFLGFVILFTSVIVSNMKDNKKVPTTDSSIYIGKVGEIISYIDHPMISINDLSIKYLGAQSQPATEEYVAMGDIYTFEVSALNGKRHQIDWSSGTGDLPGPSYIRTNDACYELQINIIEGKRWWRPHLQDIEGKLVLNKKFKNSCPEWATDLR
jgi:hypothetical protein